MDTSAERTASASSALASLADELLHAGLSADPVGATLLGFRQYDAELAHLSQAASDAHVAHLQRIGADATALDVDALDREERITRRVIMADVAGATAMEAARLEEITAAAFFTSPQSQLLGSLPQIMLNNAEQAEAYLERLDRVPAYLSTAADRLREGTARGRTTVAPLAEGALAGVDAYLTAAAADPAADPFARPEPPSTVGADWSKRREQLLAERVRPAYAAWAQAVRDVLPAARGEDRAGLVWLDGGRDDYAALARAHCTTPVDPEELHRIGLHLIAETRAEFAEVGRRALGLSDTDAVLHAMRTDPALRYRDAETLMSDTRAAVHRAEEVSRSWFGRIPSQQCAVAPVPAEVAAGQPPAYYSPPAIDGSRPGTYWVNTYAVTERRIFETEAIAFHEAVPGHHFQLALAQDLTDLPEYRRLAGFNAYAEGWGLYTEVLADEMDLYSSDLMRLGMLSAKAWRAARLVVDTGMHALGWSRSKAVAFMTENTPVAGHDIGVEIDRYLVYPGQALSYMVGRLRIQRARANAQEALGSAFDLRGFHDTVLGSGSLPLDVLDAVVQDWVESQR